ncbi:hypothetical protein PAECIP111802_00014 [Paenibacillus allorhizosphaerae]|uniref:Uncharacterized protein n=1 Tax=Paenibacillus allorhizosphaerae TaxID=2849866 RepID=A0ABM8V9N6_9BACL|nr:hypothetical protein PAECIP111802_00014 [Paenibacillus allorhizosphaerae]
MEEKNDIRFINIWGGQVMRDDGAVLTVEIAGYDVLIFGMFSGKSHTMLAESVILRPSLYDPLPEEAAPSIRDQSK